MSILTTNLNTYPKTLPFNSISINFLKFPCTVLTKYLLYVSHLNDRHFRCSGRHKVSSLQKKLNKQPQECVTPKERTVHLRNAKFGVLNYVNSLRKHKPEYQGSHCPGRARKGLFLADWQHALIIIAPVSMVLVHHRVPTVTAVLISSGHGGGEDGNAILQGL